MGPAVLLRHFPENETEWKVDTGSRLGVQEAERCWWPQEPQSPSARSMESKHSPSCLVPTARRVSSRVNLCFESPSSGASSLCSIPSIVIYQLNVIEQVSSLSGPQLSHL